MSEINWRYSNSVHAVVLGTLGRVFSVQEMPLVEVRIPKELAERAVGSWERQRDHPRGPLVDETAEERLQRRRAWTLALVGLAIFDSAVWQDDGAVVGLSPVIIGRALDAYFDFEED